MTDCGHKCCTIAGNPSHLHTAPPDSCPRCAGGGPAPPSASAPARLSTAVPAYQRATARARRATTLRLQWQEASARRRAGKRRLDEWELIRLRAVRRELAARGRSTYGLLGRM